MATDTRVKTETESEVTGHYWRFNLLHRISHVVLIVSFLGLAATGMPLRFAEADWAVDFSHTVGGFDAVLSFHKFFAVTLTLVFVVHIGYVIWLLVVKRQKGVLWGPTSMTPQPRDVRELIQHIKWFLGRGPRPEFGRFSYWEKFDYLAVFWGMMAIGLTGYVMWFSELAARVLPGWVFSVSLLVHSEEALLAAWFIFVIHFFNSHLRPEKFPMDDVIFTGRETLEELEEGRPAEYSRLADDKMLAASHSDPPPLWLSNTARIFGWGAMLVGFLLLGLTLYSFFSEETASGVVGPPDRPLVGPPITASGPSLTWESDIGPMLTDRCGACHVETVRGGLDLSSYDTAMQGSRHGPVIVPGFPEQSLAVALQQAGRHPGWLDNVELDIFISWIEAGAQR
jgi:cytochrome b subunit of formate dehydrogenase